MNAGKYIALVLVLAIHAAFAQDATNSLPPLPVTKSPVDAFRELLAMDATTLRGAMTNRSEATRKRLVEKIRAYQKMDPDERELRLQATDLRWHLQQLMAMPVANREQRLADVRNDLRPLIEARLARWDALPAELRSQFLQSESGLASLLQLGAASERLREKLVAEVSPELRATVTNALARLDSMSVAERVRAFDVFENVFNMTSVEKQRAMGVMSDAERKQMEKALEAFAGLPGDQRRQCIRSYQKFAGMKPDERVLFYRNVQLWEKMSPRERQDWRELVKNIELLPPLPGPKVELPPLPLETRPKITPSRT